MLALCKIAWAPRAAVKRLEELIASSTPNEGNCYFVRDWVQSEEATVPLLNQANQTAALV
jgi:hypothetical protein